MSKPLPKYGKLIQENKFVFVVFYRGHWCPFCIAYLKTLQSISPRIGAAGGKVIAITAEPEEHSAAMRTSTGFTGELIVDTENVLAAEMKRRGELNVAISDKSGYKNGMAQPGILIMKSDGEVLYDWAIVPGVMNLGGAKDRPDLEQVWDNAEARLNGQDPVHKKYKLQTFAQVMLQKIFR